jgi:hypothetical protein
MELRNCSSSKEELCHEATRPKPVLTAATVKVDKSTIRTESFIVAPHVE